MTTEGPSPEVAAFAAGIETASGGTVAVSYTHLRAHET
jgi:hypothetical protein